MKRNSRINAVGVNRSTHGQMRSKSIEDSGENNQRTVQMNKCKRNRKRRESVHEWRFLVERTL